MKRLSIVSITVLVMVGSAVGLYAAENETFTGAAARSGTYKHPQLLVDGKRYELKASDKADPSVAETLARFSEGETGTYVVTGTRATVSGVDGIIVDRITPAAQTTPTVTSRSVTVGNRRYTVYDYTDPATKTFCVVIPEGLKTVRGLLVECNYAGGDSRGDWTFCTYYREFMHLHDFAFVGSQGDPKHSIAFQVFRDSLQMVGVASNHPELVNAPYAATGLSAGGGFANTLMTMDPDRTIAVGIVCARYNFDAFDPPIPPKPPIPAATLAIPSVLITGEGEKLNDPAVDGRYKVDEVFVPFRPMGGQLAWMELEGYGHAYATNRQDLLVMPLLDLAVRTRYPKDGDVTKGPIQLINIDSATGWIADNTTWKSGLTQIVPATQFTGDLGHSSWLQTEDLAFIYRAYSTYNNPLVITSPGPCGPGMPALDPGSNVPITVDASKFPDWKKLEFYDGAKKLGTVTSAPAQFTATNLTPGYHVFSVLGTDGQGNLRTSNPAMVVVRSPSMDVRAAHDAAEQTNAMLPPLVDLGPGQTYNGQEGGLYPGGSNVRPAAHGAAGQKIARGIVPLDANGNPDPVNGKIVLMPVSVSNGYGAWHRGDESDTSTTFMTRATANPAKNPMLFIAYGFEYQLPGGNGGTGDPGPDSIFYKSLDHALKEQGVTPRQVQIVWLSMPVSGRSWGTNLPPEARTFPADAQQSKLAWKEIVHAIYTRYPNVKIIYSSTKGAMYVSATAPKNPEFIGGPIEPFNHDAAWGVKWVIQDQMNGAPDLNYDPARGPVKAPWLSWGPYFWSYPDGAPRHYDGFVWSIADVAADGLHPSLSGLTKYANMLLHQMTTDPTATPWFLKPGAPSNQPSKIAKEASADANPVSGGTTALSVLGADDGGEPNLTYTWSCSGPAGVMFSVNGPNRAKNTTATFPSAGRYTFQVTIADAGGLTAASSIVVTVTRR